MDYDEYLKLAGIPEGAVVDVSSDLFSMALFWAKNGAKFDADSLLDALKRCVGKNGTVMIRAYSWEFCKGIPFHMKGTRSAVGSLGITAMGRDDFRRTGHPLYSWFVWGKEQDRFCSHQNVDGFGTDSLFAVLEQEDAVQLGLGKQRAVGFTMAHYAEAKAEVPYRRKKLFTGEYYDEEEHMTERTFSMYVRPLNIPVKNTFSSPETQDALRREGIRTDGLYMDELPISVIRLREAAQFIGKDLTENDGRMTMMVDGVPGIKGCGVDWSTAVY